jgi:hypothetical protein
MTEIESEIKTIIQKEIIQDVSLNIKKITVPRMPPNNDKIKSRDVERQ